MKTDEFNVRVLGTSFNISAYSDFPLAHTTLCSGHVRLSDRMNPGKEVDILPGEQLLFHRDSREMNVQEVDVDVFVSWRDGSFQFDNNTVEEVFRSCKDGIIFRFFMLMWRSGRSFSPVNCLVLTIFKLSLI